MIGNKPIQIKKKSVKQKTNACKTFSYAHDRVTQERIKQKKTIYHRTLTKKMGKVRKINDHNSSTVVKRNSMFPDCTLQGQCAVEP